MSVPGDEQPAGGTAGEEQAPGPSSGLPTGSGRARELSRGRRRPRPGPDRGGRRHHLGAVPERMPVLLPDGTVGETRTSVVQLTAAMPDRLRELEAELEAEMRTEAAAGRYEAAARCRDELAAVRGELERRGLGSAP